MNATQLKRWYLGASYRSDSYPEEVEPTQVLYPEEVEPTQVLYPQVNVPAASYQSGSVTRDKTEASLSRREAGAFHPEVEEGEEALSGVAALLEPTDRVPESWIVGETVVKGFNSPYSEVYIYDHPRLYQGTLGVLAHKADTICDSIIMNEDLEYQNICVRFDRVGMPSGMSGAEAVPRDTIDAETHARILEEMARRPYVGQAS